VTPQRFRATIDWTQDAEAGGDAGRAAEAMAGRTGELVRPTDRLTIFLAAGTRFLPFADGSGGIVGTLFARGGARALTTLPDMLCKAPTGDRSRLLSSDFWGGYVGLWDTGTHGFVTVFRDPSGALPCYHCRGDRVTIVGSDLAIISETGLFAPAIDWRTVSQLLLATQYRAADTALIGLRELLQGFQLELSPSSATLSEIWSPWMFGRSARFVTDAHEAARLVREMVVHVVGAWASCFDHILLTVSGGLDSSLVAAALRESRVAFDCLTLFTSMPAGDERLYARAIAQAIDATLHERGYDHRQIDLAVSRAAHLPRPTARAFAQELDRISFAVAGEIGADGFFTGAGGDNVFCYLRSVTPILDRMGSGDHGGAWRTCRDICRLTDTDMWMVGATLLKRLATGRRRYRWSVDTSLMTTEAVARAKLRFDHPWLGCPDGGLAGTAAHIVNLLAIQNYLEGHYRDLSIPAMAPLLAQPLVELCLQIPTWMWAEGGIDRAVARNAFADILPREIYTRRTKGTPDSVSAELFMAQRTTVRELLLDGLLAKEGIIDRDAVETALAIDGPVRDTGYARILTLCDVEAWVRSMSDAGHGCA
jgi:asparagine synthase (glutamine-hydrolysing)